MQRGGGNEQQTRVDDPAKSPNPPPWARGQGEGEPATAKQGAGGAEPSLAGKIRANNEPQGNKKKAEATVWCRYQILPFAAYRQGGAEPDQIENEAALPDGDKRRRHQDNRREDARQEIGQATPPGKIGRRRVFARRIGGIVRHGKQHGTRGGINHVFAAPASTLPFRDCPVTPPNRRSRAENSAKAAEKACRSKSGQCIGRKTNSE